MQFFETRQLMRARHFLQLFAGRRLQLVARKLLRQTLLQPSGPGNFARRDAGQAGVYQLVRQAPPHLRADSFLASPGDVNAPVIPAAAPFRRSGAAQIGCAIQHNGDDSLARGTPQLTRNAAVFLIQHVQNRACRVHRNGLPRVAQRDVHAYQPLAGRVRRGLALGAIVNALQARIGREIKRLFPISDGGIELVHPICRQPRQ